MNSTASSPSPVDASSASSLTADDRSVRQSQLLPLLRCDSDSRLPEVLGEDVVLHSPVRDYHGRARVAHILTTIGSVMDEIDAVGDLAARNEVITRISASYQGRRMTGVLHETYDRLGRVECATLLLRPLSTLLDAISGMRTALERSPFRPEPEPGGDVTGWG